MVTRRHKGKRVVNFTAIVYILFFADMSLSVDMQFNVVRSTFTGRVKRERCLVIGRAVVTCRDDSFDVEPLTVAW